MTDVKDPAHALNEDGEIVRSYLSDDGRFEHPDATPVAPPLGYRHGPSLNDTVMRLLHQQRMRELQDMQDQELESPDEADDFDIEDDPLDPLTPWEAHFFPSDADRSEARRVEALQRFKEAFPDRAEAVDAFVRGGGGAEPPSGKPPTDGGTPSPEPPPKGPVPPEKQ